ncbi:MAG: response regulator transcription factor [Candidatus Melainabacteria bacterium]|nr:response regulator transcription factor [Candidatus Melainabacteria bacterium]
MTSSTNQKKIMLVDDDATIIETLAYNLKRHGFESVSFSRGMEALSGLDDADPCLIVLDWMLPDVTGPEVVKLIRERACEVPVLMLTGRSSPHDIAHGLSSGADDYLAKPFSTIEFMARIQALLRRTKKDKEVSSDSKITIGQLLLDEGARRVTFRGQPVDLSPKEFALLKVLMSNADKTLSTDVLLNKVWGADYQGDVKTVAVHMRWLRQKLEDDPKNPTLLETVHRSGYRLNSVERKEQEVAKDHGQEHGKTH